jgi:hypothetical protein
MARNPTIRESSEEVATEPLDEMPHACYPRWVYLEAVMNLLRSGFLMRKAGDRQRTELTVESAS